MLSEHVDCMAVTFKRTEQIQQWICIAFCIKLEHSSTETIWMTQKAVAMDLHHDIACTHASHLVQSFLVKRQITQVTQPPYRPDLTPYDFWLFQNKITFEREEISDNQWVQENKAEQLMVIGRTMWGPKVPTLKGTEVSLSYLQCFLYFLSSSINASIFHITWLNMIWTDLV